MWAPATMVSGRKRQANRANAKHSTGPRTAKGKARASRNAQWHGFAIPVAANQGMRCLEPTFRWPA